MGIEAKEKFANQEEFESNILTMTKVTMDILLKQDKPSDLIALYVFYIYTSKWQKTWKIKATTNYTMNGLGWGKDRVIKIKKQLIDLGLVEDIVGKSKVGKISGHYIQLKYPCNTPPSEKTTLWETPPVVKSDTNAYNTNNINAYNTNSKVEPSEKEVSDQSEIKSEQSNEEVSVKKTLPVISTPNTPSGRLLKVYGVAWKKKYGNVPNLNYGRDLKILMGYEAKLGEYATALVLLVYLNWAGADGRDEWIKKNLAGNCHALTSLTTHITPILAYCTNVLGLDVTNEDSLVGEINRKLKEYGIYEE